jgi:hypothetical protein
MSLTKIRRSFAIDLESRLLNYAKQQKPSEWIKAQPQFLGAQEKTIFDPDFDIDDGGLPQDKPALCSASQCRRVEATRIAATA